MTKPIPVEVRWHIVEAFDQGNTREEIADLYNVSAISVTRFLARRRKTGSLEPLPRPGRKPRLDERAETWIRGWIEQQPDLTLNELRERLGEVGYSVGLSAIFEKLRRIGFRVKKNDARRRARPS